MFVEQRDHARNNFKAREENILMVSVEVGNRSSFDGSTLET